MMERNEFFGSRLHVAICLTWVFGAIGSTYVLLDDGFKVMTIVALPASLLALFIGHALFFAMRYVITGRWL